MRFDLKVPCKNCPFRTDSTRIRFADRERAEEISETAYRMGFPCHLSAVDTSEDEDGCENEDGGYEFNPDGNTQHCAGALAMFISDGHDCTPGTGNDEELFDRLREQLVDAFPIAFETEDEFLLANERDEP